MSEFVRLERFEGLVAHLHDVHGFTAEDMAEDEFTNGTLDGVVSAIRGMSRADALVRLPYHYFMDASVLRCSVGALKSAQGQHAELCANLGIVCGFDVSS